MSRLGSERVVRYLVGKTRSRRVVVGGVVAVVALASLAFLLGFDVGLNAFGGGWIVVALAIALVAGVLGAGLAPTVGSLWLVALWWFAFPPLVGYLTGDWTGTSRYVHPRMTAFAYGSARAELLGGLRYGVRLGLFFAVVPGAIAYAVGTVAGWVASRLDRDDS